MYCNIYGAFFTDVWPPYASFLTIEIAEDVTSKHRFVRLSFNDQDVLIPGSVELWHPFADFKTRIDALSISNLLYKSECELCSVS